MKKKINRLGEFADGSYNAVITLSKANECGLISTDES